MSLLGKATGQTQVYSGAAGTRCTSILNQRQIKKDFIGLSLLALPELPRRELFRLGVAITFTTYPILQLSTLVY